MNQAQDNIAGTLRSQELVPRDEAYDKLNVFIGKWINTGQTMPVSDESPMDIATSDVYEWLPGKFFVLHTAYGRLGNMDVGGSELISYDTEKKEYYSYLFDSLGNVSRHVLTIEEGEITWKGEKTGCTADIVENGKVQRAHHVRLNEKGEWVPSMEVVLTKVID